MINWQYFPKSDQAPDIATDVVNAFERISDRIDSSSLELQSNEVLAELCEQLQLCGFLVETGKKRNEKNSCTCIVWFERKTREIV